jgi:hypothetical protein
LISRHVQRKGQQKKANKCQAPFLKNSSLPQERHSVTADRQQAQREDGKHQHRSTSADDETPAHNLEERSSIVVRYRPVDDSSCTAHRAIRQALTQGEDASLQTLLSTHRCRIPAGCHEHVAGDDRLMMQMRSHSICSQTTSETVTSLHPCKEVGAQQVGIKLVRSNALCILS